MWKDHKQVYFIIANIKICNEYMTECIFKISRCEQVCVHLFLSPQHCVYKKPKPSWAACSWLHGTPIIDCMSCFEPEDICHTYMCVLYVVFSFDSVFEFFLALFLAEFNPQLSSLETLWHKSELICVTHSLR